MTVVSVLIVEDDDAKRDDIREVVGAYFAGHVDFTCCRTFGEATQLIHTVEFDLIVVDLLLPRRADDEPTDVSEEMIDHLTQSEVNRLTTVVAISRFGDVIEQRQSAFAKAGIFLIPYQDHEVWRACLRVCMQKVSFRTVYDFVVICALEAERSAFEGVHTEGFEYGELVATNGLDARELRVGNLRGVCVRQPRMGLVDASIVTTRALEAFSPKLICMAGVCGGFSSEVPLGALLVSEVCWEHQAGKWKGDQFEIRSYQEPLANDTRIKLSQYILKDPKLTHLASRPFETAVPMVGAHILPTVSGSAVIASASYRDAIQRQHGKVAGVDMEVYGVYRAVALHGQPIICFAAKTVVDHADEKKDSSGHEGGALLSARFVAEAIEMLLAAGPA